MKIQKIYRKKRLMIDPREARLEKRLIHFYLLNEILKKKRVKDILLGAGSLLLQKHGIKRTPRSLYVTYRALMEKPEIHTLPSLIKKKPSLNREGKDKMYAAFWRMVEIEAQKIDEVVYLGLPSNQIGFVWQQLKKIDKPAFLYSFELDQEKTQWQREYAAQFLKGKDVDVFIEKEDILDFFIFDNEASDLTILDLDLMKNGTPELARKIAWLIPKLGKTIINITTCIGRSITKQEYIHSFKEVLQEEIEESHKVKHWFSGKYVDNIIPMVWEHICLK